MHGTMITRHTKEGGILAEVDTGGGEKGARQCF